MKDLSEFRTISAYYDYLSIISGNSVDCIRSRLRRGYSPETAVKTKCSKAQASDHPWKGESYKKVSARVKARKQKVEK